MTSVAKSISASFDLRRPKPIPPSRFPRFASSVINGFDFNGRDNIPNRMLRYAVIQR
jgi:hypothetical protein